MLSALNSARNIQRLVFIHKLCKLNSIRGALAEIHSMSVTDITQMEKLTTPEQSVPSI